MDTLLRTRLRRVIYFLKKIFCKRQDSVSLQSQYCLKVDKKSAVLVLTVIVISISMVISMIVSQLVIKELILARKLENSTRAFYAAQAGIEDALNRFTIGLSDSDVPVDPADPNSPRYTISITQENESGILITKIKSEGKADSTLRTILIELDPDQGTTFLEQVKFWGEVAPK